MLFEVYKGIDKRTGLLRWDGDYCRGIDWEPSVTSGLGRYERSG